MDVNDYFETSDLALAAALCCFGAKIEVVDRSNPARSVFHFRRQKGMDALIQGFWAHQLQVDPLAYFACLKEAKTRLYNA